MFWGGLSAKPQAMTPCTCTTGRGASLLLDEALRPPALWGLGHRFPLRLGDKVGAHPRSCPGPGLWHVPAAAGVSQCEFT